MKRSIFHPTHPVAASAICLAGFCAVASVNLPANDIQVGRYSLFAATPTEAQADPLQATITVQFPESVRTVGDAVRHLLQQSGYRLAGPEATGPEAAYLMALPLPAVQRSLGPMTLKQALETLAGPAFQSGGRSRSPPGRLLNAVRSAAEVTPMEIVLGILLLFGAFTLGTVTSDSTDHETHDHTH